MKTTRKEKNVLPLKRVLFTGPDAEAKWSAAKVIAKQLELRAYQVNLSSVVSKYIGETEKSLDRIFRAAEKNNYLLFFDEADALFGKRAETKDSHDRYANQDIAYLLQRIEEFSGSVIVATNLHRKLPEAWRRRFPTVIRFPTGRS
jgi:SpoVK/Ycf46/Vps4 family AAA+-type ATPase